MKGCREWHGAQIRGYGQRRDKAKRKVVLVHRWVWEQVNGPIPRGLVVMHSCDNPSCYLYEHLRLGTQAENLADMRSKGRGFIPPPFRPRGEINGNTTLTAAQVSEIRVALAAGEVQQRIADRYGVANATISRINTGKVWALDDAS